MDPPPQRVEVVVSVRTLFVLLAFGAVVALAVFSLATLLSIFVAAVLALGLDPVVGALVRRGWGRGRAAVAVFAALFAAAAAIVLITAAPLWEQILEFADALPAYWDERHEQRGLPAAHLNGRRRRHHPESAQGTRGAGCRTPHPPSGESPRGCSALSFRL